jgi:hypothetical protein
VKNSANGMTFVLAEVRLDSAAQQKRDFGKQVDASISSKNSEITFLPGIFRADPEKFERHGELENKWT